MRPFHPCLSGLLLLCALPAAAEVTLTNRTAHILRVDIDAISPEHGDLNLVINPADGHSRRREAWGAEGSQDPSVLNTASFHGVYRRCQLFDKFTLSLSPGSALVLSTVQPKTESTCFVVDFRVSELKEADALPPEPQEKATRQHHFFYSVSGGKAGKGKEKLVVAPGEDVTVGPRNNQLTVADPSASHADYRLEEGSNGACVIL